MSMMIGNNMGMSTHYQNTTSKVGGYKSVGEYSKYLMNKYSCLRAGEKVAVSVTPGMLRKAMRDEKTGKWLERELGNAPEYIRKAQQSASAQGNRLTYAAIEFGEEYTMMYTMVVTDTTGTDSDMDKWLERTKEDKEEQKTAQKNATKKAVKEHQKEQRTVEYAYTFKGSDLKSVTNSFIEKISTLNSTMSSVVGFDIKA